VVLVAALSQNGAAFAADAAAEHTLTWHPNPEGTPSADTGKQKPEGNGGAQGAVDDGQLLPFTLGAPIARANAVVKTLGGYDSSTTSARVRTAAEASLFNLLAFRLEYEHGPGTGSSDHVIVGGRIAVLNQQKHGIDGGFGFSYDAKDFRNEGNFIGTLLLGRQFGRLGVYTNARFGMDSEGDDESIELRLGGGYRVTPALQLGLDTRGRYNMSTDAKRADAQSIGWELQSGPQASLTFGPVAVLAMVGPSFISVTEAGSTTSHVASGVLALGGAGAAF
jgi:hypothetical protein